MIKLICAKHPRYTAIKPPRANCVACVVLYEARLNYVMGKILSVKP